MICPDCQAIFDDRMDTCPECGAIVEQDQQAAGSSMEGLWDEQTPSLNGSGPIADVPTPTTGIDPEKERGTRVVEAPLPPMVKKRARERVNQSGKLGTTRAQKNLALELEESGVSRMVDELIANLRLFYARLHRFDRWSLWVLCGAFIASFLPWLRVLSYGLTAGIQDYGLATAPLSALAIVLIYLRTARRRLTVPLILLQLLVVAGVGAVVVWRYISAVDIDFTYGIYITALFAALGVLTTMLRLARVNV